MEVCVGNGVGVGDGGGVWRRWGDVYGTGGGV